MIDKISLTDVIKRLRSALTTPPPHDPLFTSSLVGKAPLELLPLNPQAVIRLAHSKLHSHYPFSQVPICWRRCYEEACLWAILLLLEQDTCASAVAEIEDKIIQLCDDAIIMTGAPMRRRFIDQVLRSIDEHQVVVPGEIFRGTNGAEEEPIIDAQPDEDIDGQLKITEQSSKNERPLKRARLHDSTQRNHLIQSSMADIPSSFPSQNTFSSKEIISDYPVPRVACPSLSTFTKMLSSPKPTPTIIAGSLVHWPALTRWKDPRYWMHRTHQGRRRVPVEWGKSYVDDGWGQSIVPFGQLLQDQLLDAIAGEGQIIEAIPLESNTRKGYLAQHDLLSQIPALRNDIAVPDYCYCTVDGTEDESSEEEPMEPLLNIWLGPADTVSPAHTDPHHNLLAQVVGRKYVRLFSPDQTPHMYPMDQGKTKDKSEAEEHQEYSMANTSRIDVGLEVTHIPHPSLASTEASDARNLMSEKVDSQREGYPDFHSKAAFVECVLEPGEMLFIPRGWWHYIRSLEVSCNVSFWWD